MEIFLAYAVRYEDEDEWVKLLGVFFSYQDADFAVNELIKERRVDKYKIESTEINLLGWGEGFCSPWIETDS